MDVVRYSHSHKDAWDRFVEKSLDRIFLFYRDYMDYHADRFDDHSLLFFEQGKLIGLLPANSRGDTLYSHAGLTYGGFVSGPGMKAEKMGQIFEDLGKYAEQHSFNHLIYKAVPCAFRRQPSEEDLYWLLVNKARLISRDLSSSINFTEPYTPRESKKRAIRKATRFGVEVRQTDDYHTFMGLVALVLDDKYNKKPTHTVAEIKLLAGRFPDNIKLYGAFSGDEMLAGMVIYEFPNLVHAQYIVTSENGKSCRALDFLTHLLITEVYGNQKYYFDFGVSTEQQGQYLNMGLIFQKEGFGARGLCYDTYQLNFNFT